MEFAVSKHTLADEMLDLPLGTQITLVPKYAVQFRMLNPYLSSLESDRPCARLINRVAYFLNQLEEAANS